MIVPEQRKEGFAKPRDQFLSATIYVSGSTVRSLRTAAELLGHPTADSLANTILREALDNVEGLAELESQIARAIQKAKEGRAEPNTPSLRL